MRADMRRLLRQAALAALGLAVAAWAWLGERPTEIRAGALPFSPCAASDLKAVGLQVGARDVSVRFSDAAATISLTRRVQRTRQGAVGTPTGATPTETLTMAAHPRVQRLRRRFAPAMAKRALGHLSAARLGRLGLVKSAETLKIECGDALRRFTVGTTSYGGGGRYVQNQADGSVWLVDPTLVSDVRLADSRFVERRLVASAATALERAEVRASGKSKRLLHRNHRSLKHSEWVDAAAPGQHDELYGNWLGKVLRLRAISWLSGGPATQRDVRTGAVMRHVHRALVVRFSGGRDERVELWQGESAATGTSAGRAVFWARSAATGGWVSVSRVLGQQLIDDVAAVVGERN